MLAAQAGFGRWRGGLETGADLGGGRRGVLADRHVPGLAVDRRGVTRSAIDDVDGLGVPRQAGAVRADERDLQLAALTGGSSPAVR